MPIISGLLALVIIFGYATVIMAFRTSFRKTDTETWWFIFSFTVLATAIMLRAFYWDILMPISRVFWPETSAMWSDATSGRVANLLFNGMKVAAFWGALKCRQLMIPDHERHNWPWWKAWLHPTTIRIFPWPNTKGK